MINIIQAYEQGGKHKKKNIVCQDRTGFLCENNVYSIALADGAGNPKYTHSQVGAEVVVESVNRFLCNNFDIFYDEADDKGLTKVLIKVLRDALQSKADELGLDGIEVLSSTLLCVAVKDDKYIVCHLGDGAIGGLKENVTVPISVPDNGEYANATFFVPGPNAAERLRIIKGSTMNFRAFFLMSDGTAEFVYDDDKKSFHDGARKMALWANIKDGQNLLSDTIRTNMTEADSLSDDCSFICMSIYGDVEDVVLPNTSDEKTAILDASNESTSQLIGEEIVADTEAVRMKEPKAVTVEEFADNESALVDKTVGDGPLPPKVKNKTGKRINLPLPVLIAIGVGALLVIIGIVITSHVISEQKRENEELRKIIEREEEEKKKKDKKEEEEVTIIEVTPEEEVAPEEEIIEEETPEEEVIEEDPAAEEEAETDEATAEEGAGEDNNPEIEIVPESESDNGETETNSEQSPTINIEISPELNNGSAVPTPTPTPATSGTSQAIVQSSGAMQQIVIR